MKRDVGEKDVGRRVSGGETGELADDAEAPLPKGLYRITTAPVLVMLEGDGNR